MSAPTLNFTPSPTLPRRGGGGKDYPLPPCGGGLGRGVTSALLLPSTRSLLPLWLALAWLLLGFALWRPAALAQQQTGLVTAVDAVGMTVADMDRSVDFYSQVLSFEKVSDTEVWGADY